MTQNTIDGSLRTLPSRSEKFVAGAADSTSILTLQEPDVSSSDEYLDSSSELSEESIIASPRTVLLNTIDDSPPTLGPNILIYYPANLFEVFYIRIDRRGSIWIHPNVGGPCYGDELCCGGSMEGRRWGEVFCSGCGELAPWRRKAGQHVREGNRMTANRILAGSPRET
jgi:hypothetical protein